jgi:hypothetical protein
MQKWSFCWLLVGSFFLMYLPVAFSAPANCRKVVDEPFIEISKDSLRLLGQAALTRQLIFQRLADVAKVETGGCWNGVSDNFDKQLISIGIYQWNYGKNSAQPLLKKFRQKMGPNLKNYIQDKMPTFGTKVFSDLCLRNTLEAQRHVCEPEFLDANGKSLKHGLADELAAMLSSNEMVQVQMDFAIAEMEKTLDFAYRLFGKDGVSAKKYHWILDVIVHQGGFKELEAFKRDVNRALSNGLGKGGDYRLMTVKGILAWYAGLAASPDQDGLDCDWRYNVERWSSFIESEKFDDERFRLLVMSWMRARTANGENGRWQALAFERRAKIALDVGSVAGSSISKDNHYECVKPYPKDFPEILKKLN